MPKNGPHWYDASVVSTLQRMPNLLPFGAVYTALSSWGHWMGAPLAPAVPLNLKGVETAAPIEVPAKCARHLRAVVKIVRPTILVHEYQVSM
jgi:hypothetical protein